MGYDSKTEICGHGFHAMACSAMVESGLWSETAIERQMSHRERNSVRAAYIHKAEFLEERRLIMNWWSLYLEANLQTHVTPHEFANQTGENEFLRKGQGPVASDFCALYNTPDEAREAVASLVVSAITGRTHLWLRYVE
jgi:hypothetical protein